jgi:hypothetical protein
MSNSKIDFISDLLAHKNIKVADKERFFLLAKEELKTIDVGSEGIIKRLNEVEENIVKRLEKEGSISESKETDSSSKSTNRMYHRPKETKSFLALFNNSEGIKYLTHKFNSDKPEYDDFINLCNREFEENKKKYPNTSGKLLKRIEEFTFKEIPDWYIRNGKEKKFFKMGWSEPSFVEWYKQTNIHPALDAKWNEEMLIPFKESIEVRAGNLYSIVEQTLKYADVSDEVFEIMLKKDSLNTAEFYTDVDSFQQSLFLIFTMIKERARKNLKICISIDYENETLHEGDFKKMIITHIDSKATKISCDPEFAKGDFNSIIKNLWGLCNYEIQAEFPDGYYKRIFLTDDSKEYRNYVLPNKAISIEDTNIVKGFTHILKFY